MKKEKQELLEVRRNLLKLIDQTAFISRLSWRLNDLKNIYDINSTDPDELMSYIQDLLNIKTETREEIIRLFPTPKNRKEVQDEE